MKIAKYAASYALEELLKSIGERLILRDSIMSIAVARFVMANYKTDDVLGGHRIMATSGTEDKGGCLTTNYRSNALSPATI